jgi:hypothetical protein
VAVVAGVLGLALPRLLADEPAKPALQPSVDESVPEYKLLQDVLRIDFDRQAGGGQRYALVPKTRPPDLLRMNIGSIVTADGVETVMTGYQFGQQWLHALVEVAAKPTKTSEYVRTDHKRAMWVRNDAVPERAAGTPRFRHVTVYFTGNVNTAPKAGDPETERARKFWREAEMVSLDEAPWFTNLLTRGRAALQR